MYLMVTHIPIYVDGDQYYTDINWQRDLILARDWLAQSFGGLKLLAPSMPAEAVDSRVMQLSSIGNNDGIKIIPSFDLRCRSREFWINQRRQWLSDVRRAISDSRVVHTSASDVYRPMAFLAHAEAYKNNVATVFVGPDSDPHVLIPDTIKGHIYCAIFDQFMKRALERASLTLLKEGITYDRYQKYGKNVKAFCHSMHRQQDVINEDKLENRLLTLTQNDRPLKAVYAGRLIPGKGLGDAISAVAAANRQGTNVEYHLFGNGPEENSLRKQAKTLGIEHSVIFHGFIEYSPQFIDKLSTFDILLFMPTQEDTARMVYDAMAAGLPILGTRIPFIAHRVKTDQIGVLVNIGDSLDAARQLCQLHGNPESIKTLSRAARTGGHRHACEAWYRRRSEWTQEAVNRNLAGQEMPDR